MPERNYIVRIGAFSYYWIWINIGTQHQNRCWIANYRSNRTGIIHLSHWKWWKPLWQFPRAFKLARDLVAKS